MEVVFHCVLVVLEENVSRIVILGWRGNWKRSDCRKEAVRNVMG